MRSTRTPKVSVIVPVYKTEETLDKCIHSILNGTFADIEVLIIDDSSPNGFECNKYAKIDSRVRVIRHEINKGLSAVRNEGIRQAKAPYISFVDSDDWISPNMLDELYRLAIKHNANIVSCGAVEYVGKSILGNQNKDLYEEFSMDGLEALRLSLISDSAASHTAWGKLYEKILFEGISYPEGRIHEDAATTYQLYYKACKVIHSKKKHYFYRLNSKGIANSGFKPSSMDKLVAATEIIEFSNIYCSDLKKHAQCFLIISALRIAADFTPDMVKRYPAEHKKVHLILINSINRKNKLLSCHHKILLYLYKYCKPFFRIAWKNRLKR